VVRLLGDIVSAAKDAKVPLSVCGEMAANREGALLLAGLGYRELSMAPTSIRQVRHALASFSLADVERTVATAIRADTLTVESFAVALREKQRETPAAV
jgi:phosphoenolpyruvate-protein kinase (PTS system EI component)